MGKIYDVNGAKMNLSTICQEIIDTATDEQKRTLSNCIGVYQYDNSQMKLAHGVLDAYKSIDGTTDQGMRMRKLLDNLMNKYQKSTGTVSTEDQAVYHNLIRELSK